MSLLNPPFFHPTQKMPSIQRAFSAVYIGGETLHSYGYRFTYEYAFKVPALPDVKPSFIFYPFGYIESKSEKIT